MSTETWSDPTEDQINEWKREHKVDQLIVLKARDKSDGKEKKAYLRPAKMGDLNVAAASNSKKAGTYNQSLYENCVLTAHPDIKAKQDLYQGVIFSMDNIVIAADVEVEKI